MKKEHDDFLIELKPYVTGFTIVMKSIALIILIVLVFIFFRGT